MTTADDYIAQVLSHLPRAMRERDRLPLELRSHIEERVAHGQPLAAVLQQLGDPARLAESVHERSAARAGIILCARRRQTDRRRARASDCCTDPSFSPGITCLRCSSPGRFSSPSWAAASGSVSTP